MSCEMKKMIFFLIVLIMLAATSCFELPFHPVSSSYSCRSRSKSASCSSFRISFCQNDGMAELPGCHIEEKCTDITDAGTNQETDTGDTDDSDSNPNSRVCKQVCVGELLSCEEMEKDQCIRSYHCSWTN